MKGVKLTVLMSLFLGFFVLGTVQAREIQTVRGRTTYKQLYEYLLNLHLSSTQKTAEYGQPCNATTLCVSIDTNDPIICGDNNICRCITDMFRHVKLDRCVSPHNAYCTLEPNKQAPNPIKTCTKFAQCRPIEEGEGKDHFGDEHVLEGEGICLCDSNTKFDPFTGRCKLIHGTKGCNVTTECDIRASLACLQGECVCQDVDNQIYDKKQEKCLTLVGGSCAGQRPFPKPECGENMNCINNTCQCLDDFEETEVRKCVKMEDGR